MDFTHVVAHVFASVRGHLNEQHRRLLLGALAMAAGRGGTKLVAAAAVVAVDTVRLGRRELLGKQPIAPAGRVRALGGGRKRLQEDDPALIADLDRLVEPTTRGEPTSPLRWTCKSSEQLAAALREQGHRVSGRTVIRLLHEMSYSLQANAKLKEGKQHPDRDRQFAYLNQQVEQHQAQSAPVLSVDTKKKELVGEFKNGGREWQPQGRPEAVNVHDFPSQGWARRSPTASMTWAATAAGSASAPTMTPPASRWRRCVAGGRVRASTPIRTRVS